MWGRFEWETSSSPLCVRGAWTKVVEAEMGWGEVAGLMSSIVGYTDRSELRPTVSRAECKPGEAFLTNSAVVIQLSTRPESRERWVSAQRNG